MGIPSDWAMATAAPGLAAFEADRKINVRVYDHTMLQPGELAHVQEIAGGILRVAGVEATWHSCRSTEDESARDPECNNTLTPTDLIASMALRLRPLQAGSPRTPTFSQSHPRLSETPT